MNINTLIIITPNLSVNRKVLGVLLIVLVTR